MPRTKVAKKMTKTKTKTDKGPIDTNQLLEEFLKFKKAVEDEIKLTSKKIGEFHNESYVELISRIRDEYLDMTMGELEKLPTLSLNSSVSSRVVSNNDILNQTKTVKIGREPVSRSSSCDEGYLTTESSTKVSRTSSTIRDRSRIQKTTCRRASKSLSRNNNLTHGLLTPADKRGQPDSFGPVIPKCKPNTPQILLRRPKQGELALSFQGSPLMVNVIQDNAANINIPLNDGTVLSLQPQKGLRLSQIPHFDEATLQQLETLNEHINMVLAKTNLMS